MGCDLPYSQVRNPELAKKRPELDANDLTVLNKVVNLQAERVHADRREVADLKVIVAAAQRAYASNQTSQNLHWLQNARSRLRIAKAQYKSAVREWKHTIEKRKRYERLRYNGGYSIGETSIKTRS